MSSGAGTADFDVAIAGFGPAGATLACLLGAQGLRTFVVDRLTGIYDKPRAFAMDHEVMRVFQNIGLADAIAPHVAPFSASEHYGVDGQLIRRLTMIDPPYPLGWTPSMVFRQPPLEAALREKVRATPGVTVSLGEELESFTQDAGNVTLALRRGSEVREVTARYLVGCDGASSTVRRTLGIQHEDLGFDEPWLVVDVGVNAQGAAKCPATSAQFCEPSRPTTFLIGVGEHRRWEIMLLPGEVPHEVETDAAVWKLLSRWLTPQDGTLWRRASYRFHALVASRWREARVFLAGDAAHQQPPFLGQGMCQGIRDVANLAWKLAAVLQGRAGDALLDTYGEERGSHVRRLTTTIEHIGRNICERDEAKARARDADLIAQAGGSVKSVPRQDLIPPLDGGLLATRPNSANGTLFPQPRVAVEGRSALLDDVAGCGLRLVLGADADSGKVAALENVRRSGAQVVQVGGKGWPEADGIVTAWFARHGACAALVRPDHYVYGVASKLDEIDTLAAAFHAACRK
ncbi:MAG: bifunctional 3-(3-hydroxy-phenyl)propionate/3-hydroxycinnamic acid hydroxylase [Betaproteobacteria bacterium]